MDAENVHRLALRSIRLGSRMHLLRGSPLETPRKYPQIFGMEFLSRAGLAAGFDKDCEILEALPFFGFGFAEIGTVTPKPQPGNDRPRLFRTPETCSIFNRMGFNGSGAECVARNLAKARKNLPDRFRVGVNVGKNRDTSIEQAAKDYELAIRPFEGLADYLVINVSSPNTPGLRSLQTLEALRPIFESVSELLGKWPKRPPVLLKLAPELAGELLTELIPSAEAIGVEGWVLTNTLAGTFPARGGDLKGGWSGSVLTTESRERLREAKRASRLPIISVGGIMSIEEAVSRIELGAELIQVYSGWIYGGPRFPAQVSKAISDRDCRL